MRRALSSLVLAGSLVATSTATPAGAQSLDLGTPSGSGCCAFGTRGYSFVAPMAFTITSLSIRGATGNPLDATLQVLRFNSPLPSWPGTSNDFTSLFFVAGTASAATNIAIGAGEFIAVLGHANGSTPYNVEGAPFASSIGGSPVTLHRTGFQDLGMAHDVWTESGPLGMIDLTYSTATTAPEPSTVILLGTGLAAVAAAARRRRRGSAAA